jgi:poly-gamma-glutamate synthesis protein (capsule biosynthesis protein)
MKSRLTIAITLIMAILVACSPLTKTPQQSMPVYASDTPTPNPTQTASPTQSTVTPTNTESATPSPTSPTPIPAFWAAAYVPEEIAAYVAASTGMDMTSNQQTATLILDQSGEEPVALWIYALAAPFPTIVDSVTEADLWGAWSGNLGTSVFTGIPLLMDQETHDVFSAFWGMSATNAVKVVPSDEILQNAWENQPSWAIIPFDQLDPQWKVLQIDGLSPIQKNFAPDSYPLAVPFGLIGDSNATSILDHSSLPFSNRSSDKMTDIMLTGVTALVRGTALTMERKGITYPGEDIAPMTTAVDFMHVNNEIPFMPDCPFPELYPGKLVFCSDVRYLELIQKIGTDFIEVSGDHFGDHGPEGTLFTLDLYDEVGLPYYGGGRNLEDGRQPYLIEHHGNKIAILGCNAKGSEYYAPANEVTPGAVPCDFDWMEGEITRLKDQGYQVIVTFQHIEYYSYQAQPDLVRDFGRMAAAGAIIVSGSQSHQAHGMAFADGAFIHYGLGNLFFDQYLYCEEAACDYGFMDRHIIYDGQHISTELIPIRFIDMARPRPMTVDERAWFLDWIFEASGW